MKQAVIFERDGVLNRVPAATKNQVQPLRLDEFVLNEEARAPLLRLKDAGLLLLTTTNQPGLSRGSLARRELDFMHQVLMRRLPMDDILVCPHDDADRCPCRKPKAGLLFEAAFKWHLDLERCFVVSDKWQDASAAHIAGCTSILIKSPLNGGGHHDFVVPDLAAAAAKIVQVNWRMHSLSDEACVA